MSKYTTEVRFICEQKSGLIKSVGFSDVDTVIANSWDKIFTSNVSIFDENYRSVICKKILKHFYLREICCETVGIWQLWMNTRLEEIMPYYNQLYESAKIKFDPLHDVDLTRVHNLTSKQDKKETSDDNRNVIGNRESNSTTNTTRNNEHIDNSNKKDLYSDTPQGSLSGVENESYLTNARKITDNTSGNINETGNATENTGSDYNETEKKSGNVNGTLNNTEDYIETVKGKQGGGNFSSLLNEYRTTLLNIDMQVIEEFNDLFINLW